MKRNITPHAVIALSVLCTYGLALHFGFFHFALVLIFLCAIAATQTIVYKRTSAKLKVSWPKKWIFLMVFFFVMIFIFTERPAYYGLGLVGIIEMCNGHKMELPFFRYSRFMSGYVLLLFGVISLCIPFNAS